MASLNKDVVKRILFGTVTCSELVTKGLEPSKSLRRIVKIIVPSIKSRELETLLNINDILQTAYFKPYEGKFRYEIWEPKEEYISFKDKNLQIWLENIKREQGFRHLGFAPDVALLMGSTVQNFCKRFSYLLREIALSSTSLKEVAILSGNRILQEKELAYFNECLFASETPIVTEFDAMNAIFSSRKNVELMLQTNGVDPLEKASGNGGLSINKMITGVKMDALLRAYDSIQKIVRVNEIHPKNKPTTDGTVVEYLKENDVKNKNIVVVSSQPFNDYQLLTTLNTLVRAKVLPRNLGAIGPEIIRIPAKMFGNHIAKTVYTILDILKNAGFQIEEGKTQALEELVLA